MIREELEMLISGAVSQSGIAIEAVDGRKLTRSELEQLAAVFATFGRIVAERAAGARIPPPPPPPRPQARAVYFNPLRTQEIRPVPKEIGEK